MDPIRRVAQLIEPVLTDLGYDLVRARMSGTARVTLQIMAERRDRKGMTVEDCASISHAVSAVLDVEDPIRGAYTLEVSSPGIDRPLTRVQDFERFTGFEARVEIRHARADQRRFRGRIAGVENGVVRITTKDGEVAFPFEDVQNAKLVLTDELLAAAAAEAVGANE